MVAEYQMLFYSYTFRRVSFYCTFIAHVIATSRINKSPAFATVSTSPTFISTAFYDANNDPDNGNYSKYCWSPFFVTLQMQTTTLIQQSS
jgi:hypothetical protein